MVLASNFLVPNATFIVELAAFLVVLGLLARYVLPYVNKVVDERQAVIRQALVDAEDAKRRSEEAETQYKQLIDQARNEARGLIEEANRLAEQLRNEKRQQADQEYNGILARARADIESETRRATEELRQQIAELVIAVVEKVIGEGLDLPAHRALIDRTIADVEAQTNATGVSA